MARKKSGVLLLIGALIGAVTALFFTTTEEGETREEVQKKIKLLKLKLKEAREKDVVKKVFGEKSEEMAKLFNKTKDDLVTKLASLKGTLDQIDKKKYMDAVESVVSDLKKNTEVTAKQIKNMKEYLAQDYKKLTSETKKKTLRKVKKA